MAYTTALYVVDYFGATEMAELGSPESNLVTGDLLLLTINGGDVSAFSVEEQAAALKAEARINNAINSAEQLINSYLSGHYVLPLAAELIAKSNLQQVACDLARHSLTDDQNLEHIEKRYKEHLRWLRDLASGRASLGELDTTVSTSVSTLRTPSSSLDMSGY